MFWICVFSLLNIPVIKKRIYSIWVVNELNLEISGVFTVIQLVCFLVAFVCLIGYFVYLKVFVIVKKNMLKFINQIFNSYLGDEHLIYDILIILK